jgi:hypothetical protein
MGTTNTLKTHRTLLQSMAVLLACTLLAQPPSAASGGSTTKTYKYKNEDGTTVYGDKFPPEAAPQEKLRLNENGVPLEQMPAQPSEEELREREEREEREAAREKAEADLRERVNNLHRSFPLEDDLHFFHESQLEATVVKIAANDRKLRRLRTQLVELEKQAESYNYPYRPANNLPDVPDDIVEQLLDVTERIAEREHDAATLRRNLQAQKQRYASDLNLYRNGGANSAPPRADGAAND